MNEFMRVSPVGLKLIAEFEGAPRTKARLCEGGRYELSYGCTTWPDGRPVMAGETCTEDQALILFAFHLHRFEAVVKKHIKVELNQYQFDACVALAYNVGPEQFATSTVVSCMNEKRWDDAAAAFSRFVYATKKASQRTDKEPLEWFLAPQEYEPQTYDAEGKPLPLVPLPRKQVPYRRALRGLLRRHMAEGLVSLGMPYEDACNDEAIRMRTERVWNAKHGRNEDLVRMQTEWDEVRAVALEKPRLPLPEMPDLEVADVPFDLDAWEAKEKAWLASLPIDVELPQIEALVEIPEFEVAPEAPAVNRAPAPVPAPAKTVPGQVPPPVPKPAPKLEYEIPKGTVTPSIPPPGKSLENTRRFWGATILYGGKIFMALAVTTLPSKVAIAFGEAHGVLIRDPTVFALAIDFLTMTTGWCMDHCGHWIRKWGEKKATRPMVSGSEHDRVITPTTTTTVTATTSVAVAKSGG